MSIHPILFAAALGLLAVCNNATAPNEDLGQTPKASAPTIDPVSLDGSQPGQTPKTSKTK